MGRYTTVQTYSDSNPKVATVTYSDAGTAPVAGGGKFEVNKVNNVSGSTAGAGSSTFHIYRHHRRVEMARVEAMEREHDSRAAEEVFERRVEESRLELEEKQRKRADKRRKRKAQKQAMRSATKERRKEGTENAGSVAAELEADAAESKEDGGSSGAATPGEGDVRPTGGEAEGAAVSAEAEAAAES